MPAAAGKSVVDIAFFVSTGYNVYAIGRICADAGNTADRQRDTDEAFGVREAGGPQWCVIDGLSLRAGCGQPIFEYSKTLEKGWI